MDTEFPGIVLHPIGNFKSSCGYHYQNLKENVDMLKLIQVGLTFSDKQGNLPISGTDKYCIWHSIFLSSIQTRTFLQTILSSCCAIAGSISKSTMKWALTQGGTCLIHVGFVELINAYFPTLYDIKHLMMFCNSLHGWLNKLAELLEVDRVGICHQVGSDRAVHSETGNGISSVVHWRNMPVLCMDSVVEKDGECVCTH
ncbi:hypothetical protein Nepgr_016151 [Nepenthes gracilis]|uniref:Uncharacterized protein n=1 Tax=Nepenthes gracilis TaxID=150966 RepID=A0AAD3XS92_NEPGR|nr:hypothetical protein Nepgr_016151 [Nepenthes gracilis]